MTKFTVNRLPKDALLVVTTKGNKAAVTISEGIETTTELLKEIETTIDDGIRD